MKKGRGHWLGSTEKVEANLGEGTKTRDCRTKELLSFTRIPELEPAISKGCKVRKGKKSREKKKNDRG